MRVDGPYMASLVQDFLDFCKTHRWWMGWAGGQQFDTDWFNVIAIKSHCAYPNTADPQPGDHGLE